MAGTFGSQGTPAVARSRCLPPPSQRSASSRRRAGERAGAAPAPAGPGSLQAAVASALLRHSLPGATPLGLDDAAGLLPVALAAMGLCSAMAETGFFARPDAVGGVQAPEVTSGPEAISVAAPAAHLVAFFLGGVLAAMARPPAAPGAFVNKLLAGSTASCWPAHANTETSG